MIDFEQASALVIDHLRQMVKRTEIRSLSDSVGFLLAEDIVADTALPMFTNAAVDGIAVRFQQERSQWNIIDEIVAGHFRPLVLRDDEAFMIMTGARVPDEADTIIPIEDLHCASGIARLRQGSRYRSGMNVRRSGEDMPEGMVAIHSGTLITPAVIPLLAACGRTDVSMIAPWNCAVLTTGDELIPHGDIPRIDAVRATNRPMLLSAITASGLRAVDYGIIKDDPTDLSRMIDALYNDATVDVIITTGGISVGTKDLLAEVLQGAGADIVFRKVNMKPGKPVMFSMLHSKERTIPVISLPGNPLSAYVTWRTLFSPFLSPVKRRRLTATMESTYKKEDGKRHFLCGRLLYSATLGFPSVRITGRQSSGNMTALASADCLIVIPESVTEMKEGVLVECIPISPR